MGIDLIWAIAAGIVMGVIVAKVVSWIDHALQKRRPVDDLMADFVAIGIILLTYSLTELVNGYGFLAVFVAGLVIQNSCKDDQEQRLAQLEFTEKIEKLHEIAAIVILGTVLLIEPMLKYAGQSLLIGALLFLIIRPLGVWLSFLGVNLPNKTKNLLGWFCIRGLGSIYYLTYALGEGVKGETAEQIVWITLTIVVFSINIHGITAAPLIAWYERVKSKK